MKLGLLIGVLVGIPTGNFASEISLQRHPPFPFVWSDYYSSGRDAARLAYWFSPRVRLSQGSNKNQSPWLKFILADHHRSFISLLLFSSYNCSKTQPCRSFFQRKQNWGTRHDQFAEYKISLPIIQLIKWNTGCNSKQLVKIAHLGKGKIAEVSVIPCWKCPDKN